MDFPLTRTSRIAENYKRIKSLVEEADQKQLQEVQCELMVDEDTKEEGCTIRLVIRKNRRKNWVAVAYKEKDGKEISKHEDNDRFILKRSFLSLSKAIDDNLCQ